MNRLHNVAGGRFSSSMCVCVCVCILRAHTVCVEDAGAARIPIHMRTVA